MSIKEEILTASGVTQRRGEDDQTFFRRVIKGVFGVADDVWNGLSREAQEWYNQTAEALNDDKSVVIAFPSEKAASTRRAAPAEEPAEEAVTEDPTGRRVQVTNSRGKVVEGVIVEIDGDTMIVQDDEKEEHEFQRTRVKEVVFLDDPEPSGEGNDGEEDLQPGDTVAFVTKRGKAVEGELVELTDELAVVKVDGEEEEFQLSRIGPIERVGGEAQDASSEPEVGDTIEGITKRGKEVVGTLAEIDGSVLIITTKYGGEEELDMNTAREWGITKKGAKSLATGATRARTEGKSTGRAVTAAKGKESKEGKAAKVTKGDNGGVSVTVRMREIVCENPDISMEQVSKQLAKEKMAFKEATLKINYKATMDVIKCLKEYGHFK